MSLTRTLQLFVPVASGNHIAIPLYGDYECEIFGLTCYNTAVVPQIYQLVSPQLRLPFGNPQAVAIASSQQAILIPTNINNNANLHLTQGLAGTIKFAMSTNGIIDIEIYDLLTGQAPTSYGWVVIQMNVTPIKK
jgi:hypothetical protein